MSALPVPEGLAERVAAARHVMVLTGGGVSAESGVPTFREAQPGLWSRFGPEELNGIDFGVTLEPAQPAEREQSP